MDKSLIIDGFFKIKLTVIFEYNIWSHVSIPLGEQKYSNHSFLSSTIVVCVCIQTLDDEEKNQSLWLQTFP